MPLGCHERPSSAERKSPAVEPATQWPFTRERCRTLGPSSAAAEAPLPASTTKMPLAVPMIAVFMPHLRGCPCAASGATIGPAGAVVKEQLARQRGIRVLLGARQPRDPAHGPKARPDRPLRRRVRQRLVVNGRIYRHDFVAQAV